jgi:hypothetical protein
MTTTTNNKNNIDTIVSETINTIIPAFLNKILKNNKKVLDGVLQLLKEDNEIETSIKELVLSNIPQPVVKVAKVRKNIKTKPKDPYAPRKPKSAYLIFCQDNRNEMILKFPDLLPKEILSKLGAAWKEIKDEPACAPYIHKANKEREKYDNEMCDYTPSDKYNKELAEYNAKPENVKKTKTKKNKVDPDKPKKPQTIFFKFSKEMRNKVKEENPDMKSEDVAVELGRLWKNEVTQEEKDEYKEIFKTEMIEYKRLIEEYNTNNNTIKQPEEVPEEVPEEAPEEEKKVSKKKTIKQPKEEPEEEKKVSKKKTIKQPKEEPEEEKKVSKKKTIKQPKEEPEDEPEEEKKVSKKKTIKQSKEEPEEEKKVSKKKTIKQPKEEPEDEPEDEPEEEKQVSKKKTIKQSKEKKLINNDSDDDDEHIIPTDDDEDNIIVNDSDIENMINNTDDEEIIYDSD